MGVKKCLATQVRHVVYVCVFVCVCVCLTELGA